MFTNIRTLGLTLITSLFIASCGGGSSSNSSTANTSTSPTTSGVATVLGGSVTFTDPGAVDIGTGTTFIPEVGSIVDGPHPYTGLNSYKASWEVAGSTTGEATIIQYLETTESTGTNYTVSVSYNMYNPLSNSRSWNALGGTAQVSGVSVNKATKTVTFTNVILNGMASSNTTSTLILNGSLTAP